MEDIRPIEVGNFTQNIADFSPASREQSETYNLKFLFLRDRDAYMTDSKSPRGSRIRASTPPIETAKRLVSQSYSLCKRP